MEKTNEKGSAGVCEFRVHRVGFFDYVPSAVLNLAYDKNSNKLALSREDGSIEIWNLSEGWFQEKVFLPQKDGSVEAVQWCQGRLLSAGLHGDILEHDLVTLTVKSRVSANGGAIWCLVTSPEGSRIAAGTEDGCVVLFQVSKYGIEYERVLDRLSERILCISWYIGDDGENLIVTGGVDNIRIWDVKSGHVKQRLTLGRTKPKKETIVWAVAIAQNFTIVSGDSRGQLLFWNGRTGTPIKTVTLYPADILTVVVNKSGTTVYASGVHPEINSFEVSEDKVSGKSTWVRSRTFLKQDHDIRALAVTDNCLISAGVDCSIYYHSLQKERGSFSWRKISPIRENGSLVATAKEANVILLQYPDFLDIWKLGKTLKQSDKTGEILPLRHNPINLIQLKSRGNVIVCSDISCTGKWIAYSDQETVRLFCMQVKEVELANPQVSLNRVKLASTEILPAHRLKFTPNEKVLISATCEGSVQLVNLSESEPSLLHTFTVQPEFATGIHLLEVSNDSHNFAIGDHKCIVGLYNIKKKNYIGSLPTYKCQPTAMCFHPTRPFLLVAYTNQKIVEYNFESEEYTKWSRHVSNQWHRFWLKRTNKKIHITYNLQNPNQFIVAETEMLIVIDRSQAMPSTFIKLFDEEDSETHAIHACKRFKYILHMDMLRDDYLLIVEKSPEAIVDQLPPTIKVKKFGI